MLQVQLKVIGGKQDGKLLPLPNGRFLVGREEDCNLRPKSELVSRHHCVFSVDEFTARLRDLGSTNGTFVNDERILGQVVLNQGDEVKIGKLHFAVQVKEVEQAAPVEEEIVDEAALGETAAPSSSDTLVDVEIPPEIAAAAEEEFSEGQTVIEQPAAAAPAPEQVFLQPPQQMPPGQQPVPGQPMPGYPQYGYPQYPGYPPPQMPYPGQAPYPYPPQGYPQMPPGAVPGQPPVEPPPPVEETPTTTGEGNTEVAAMPMQLPDPSTTGAKEPEPKEEKPKSEDGGTEENPSERAEDIIRQYMRREPGA